MTRIRFSDLELARACVQWLIAHVGPVENSTGGSRIKSAGWDAVVDITAVGPPTVLVELNEHVDEDILLMFILKWSCSK